MAKLTESYLRGMIKQVMNEMKDFSDFKYLEPVRTAEEAEEIRRKNFADMDARAKKQKPFKNLVAGSLTPEESMEQIRQNQQKDLERMDKNKPSAFDDKYFGEHKSWEEAMMNLESVMTDYQMGSMTAKELSQAADELSAVISSAPTNSDKAELSKLVADAHKLSLQQSMYESRKPRTALKGRK